VQHCGPVVGSTHAHVGSGTQFGGNCWQLVESSVVSQYCEVLSHEKLPQLNALNVSEEHCSKNAAIATRPNMRMRVLILGS
jgi:hypothetical protein